MKAVAAASLWSGPSSHGQSRSGQAVVVEDDSAKKVVGFDDPNEFEDITKYV